MPTFDTLVVPAYIKPDPGPGQDFWDQLVWAAGLLGEQLIVIANGPNSGPASANEPIYNDYFKKLQGSPILGYVDTNYATQRANCPDPIDVCVQNDIDAWFNNYQIIDGWWINGIFFDNVSTKIGDRGFYETAYNYLQWYARPTADVTAIFNFGTDPLPTGYSPIGDSIFCVYERAFVPPPPPPPPPPFMTWQPTYDDGSSLYGNLLALVYDTPPGNWKDAVQHAIDVGMGWLYVTEHPWDPLPSYFHDLVLYMQPPPWRARMMARAIHRWFVERRPISYARPAPRRQRSSRSDGPVFHD